MSKKLSIKDLVVEARKPSGEWFRIIHNVDVDVHAGEIVALIGESGAGKSTIGLSALAYSRPGTRIAGGSVHLDEVNLLELNKKQIRKVRGKKVAYVAQSASAALNPAIKLGRQVTESLRLHGILEANGWDEHVMELFSLLNLPQPEELAGRYPHQVSGGQQQRVMTAMAMASLPDFIVFDEPTTALDVTTQVEVLKAIKDVIREKGTGAIYVSHDLSVVAQVADRIVVLYDGKVVENSKNRDILASPREEYTRLLLSAVKKVPKESTLNKKVSSKSIGKPLVEMKNITASYKKPALFRPVSEKHHILQGINLTIRQGEVVALVGESGSGKSTIARVMTGLLPQLSGDVTYAGTRLSPKVKQRSLEHLRLIQMVCQSPDTTLNPQQPILEAIGRPLELYFGLKAEEKLARVKELLSLVELPEDYALRYPPELSGGEKQRVSLARAFGANPSIILCDEVLSALDTIVATAVLDLLRDLKNQMDVAYLFISHDLATVASIADRVIVLYSGRVCEDGPIEKVFSPPFHPYTALLLSSVPELKQGWLEDHLDSRNGKIAQLAGNINDIQEKGKCPFFPRCPVYDKNKCGNGLPEAKDFGNNHFIYCHAEADRLTYSRPYV